MTTRPTRWLARRLGRRGAALALLGVVYVAFGIQIALVPAAPDPTSFYLHTWLPMPVRVLTWVVPGLLALWAAFRRGPDKDGFGFVGLVVPLVIRIASFAWSFVAFLAGAGDRADGLIRSLLYLALLGLVLIIAGWAEVPSGYAPRKRRRRRHRV